MSFYRTLLNCNDDITNNPDFLEFYNENELFRKFVNKDSSLTTTDLVMIKDEFTKKFPEKDFDEFLTHYEINDNDICLEQPIYNTKTNKNIPLIYNPVNRKQTNDFNMQDFLRESISNNQTYYLNFDPDPEFDLDDEDFEERNKQLILADQALKSIGTIALCLNKQRKEIPYTLMDVKAENYIN